MSKSVYGKADRHLAGVIALGQTSVQRATAETRAVLDGLRRIDSLLKQADHLHHVLTRTDEELQQIRFRTEELTGGVKRLDHKIEELMVR